MDFNTDQPHIMTMKTSLPDVSQSEKTQHSFVLSQVGMQKIQMPIMIEMDEKKLTLPATIDAFVSLDDPDAKGIHMSRLYLEVRAFFINKILNPQHLQELLKKFLETHESLSQKAFVQIRFQLPIERKALLSDEYGYRHYPVFYKASLERLTGNLTLDLGTEILYSSTCPCSASLARQLNSEEFLRKFADQDLLKKEQVARWLNAEEAMAAVPHAQRSVAQVKVRLKNAAIAPGLLELIDRLEGTLGTPVQTAVKRKDEQEFARLNAKNLMFCEDAARRLRNELENDVRIADYFIHVEHQESLHPHNAVSRVVKGLGDGYHVDEKYDS